MGVRPSGVRPVRPTGRPTVRRPSRRAVFPVSIFTGRASFPFSVFIGRASFPFSTAGIHFHFHFYRPGLISILLFSIITPAGLWLNLMDVQPACTDKVGGRGI